uniref:hypothetical protein n=1 Tax=uncultured Draconibacterium sp. TaxID=1573823 RepID=UPI003216711E
MMESNDFDLIILNALNRIESVYYSTVYENIEAIKGAFAGRSGNYSNGNFERFGERVFCYELYHQMRLEIEKYKRAKVQSLEQIMLQGEVRKPMILELMDLMDCEPYDNDFIPDFLLHSPGNSNRHIFAMEVKATDDFTESAFNEDLKKLNHLITGFGYENAYFLSVNSELNSIYEFLGKIDLTQLDGRGKIKIIWKKDFYTKSKIWNL